jgi:hypothetical protein
MRRRKLSHGRMLSFTNGADDDGTYVPKDFEDWREIPSEALERSEIRDALAMPWLYSKNTTGWPLFFATSTN